MYLIIRIAKIVIHSNAANALSQLITIYKINKFIPDLFNNFNLKYLQ